MPPKRKTREQLRQTTLFGTAHLATAPRTRTSTSINSLEKTKRKRNLRSAPEEEEDTDIHASRLQPRASASHSDERLNRKSSSPKSLVKRHQNLINSEDSHSEPTRVGHRRQTIQKAKRTRLSRRVSSGEESDESPRKKIAKREGYITSEGEDDIADEVEEERILSTRLRARNKMTPFQKNLEKLKRRKLGKTQVPQLSSSSGEGSECEQNDAPFKGAKPDDDWDSLFDEDSQESDSSNFIVEDGDTVQTSLPSQFSMESHQDLSHQFKKVFQFFVHIAVRPAKERRAFMEEQIQNEEYFSVPLQMTRRKLSSLKDSLVASSVWRPDFRRSLERYPEFDLIPLDFATPICHACNLGGRMSTLTGRLSGLPYDRMGFEIMDESDEDDDDSDNDNGGAAVVDFQLGRFCGKRTRVYHEFTHWEYSLFQCIRQEVDELHESNQSGGFFRIAYAGGKKPPKDLDDADGICDWLDERKVIDMEWEKMKSMMESARHLEMTSHKRDED